MVGSCENHTAQEKKRITDPLHVNSGPGRDVRLGNSCPKFIFQRETLLLAIHPGSGAPSPPCVPWRLYVWRARQNRLQAAVSLGRRPVGVRHMSRRLGRGVSGEDSTVSQKISVRSRSLGPPGILWWLSNTPPSRLLLLV